MRWGPVIAVIARDLNFAKDMTGAYSFICKESSTDQLCKRLNTVGGWSWAVGDSYWYGDYVVSRPFEGVRIRIVDFPKRVNDEFQYDADVRLRESKTPMEVIDAEFRKILAQIGAHDVQEIEPFD